MFFLSIHLLVMNIFLFIRMHKYTLTVIQAHLSEPKIETRKV